MQFSKKIWVSIAITFLPSINVVFADGISYPHAVLSNQDLKVTVYLPDAEKGFYRSSRFDWSSMIASVEYDGHCFFGDFVIPRTPEMTDGASGIAEEFKTPLGYDSAAPGESFLKIGAGIFKRPDDAFYSFSRQYPLIKPATWSMIKGNDWIQFENDASMPPYSYHYIRKISLQDTAIIVEHTLRNTGKANIATEHYSHNFIIIDGMPVGKAYSVTCNFRLMIGNKWPDIVALGDNSIQFLRDFCKKDFQNIAPAGIADDCNDTSVSVFNTDKNAGILVDAQFPVSQYIIHINPKAICPEPFLNINLKPGSYVSWRTRYVFFTGKPAEFAKKEIEQNSKDGLASISFDGKELEDFSATKYSYNIVLLAGQNSIPKVGARVFSDASSLSLKQPTSLDGTAIISLTLPGTEKTMDYTLKFVKTEVAAVTASENSVNLPINTLDQDLRTSWAAEGDNKWIMYDFGQLRLFKGMGIAWYAGNKRKTRFDIELSPDGQKWLQVFSGESSGTTTGMESLYFDKASPARFIRITGHGNNMGKWNNITETVFYQQ